MLASLNVLGKKVPLKRHGQHACPNALLGKHRHLQVLSSRLQNLQSQKLVVCEPALMAKKETRFGRCQ